MLLRSLSARLTLLYLGVAAAVLVISVTAIIWADLLTFRDGVNTTLHPALSQAVQVMAEQRGRGLSVNDAAIYTIAHFGRPNLRLSVFDSAHVHLIGAFLPRNWFDYAVDGNYLYFGFRNEVASIPGASVVVTLNSANLVDRIASDALRLLPAALILLVIAFVFGCLIASYASGPLFNAAAALRGLGYQDAPSTAFVASNIYELRELHSAHNAAAESIEKAVADRELAAENVRNFISDASHQLKTPLTIIMGYVDAVSEGLIRDPEDARRILKKSLGECRRMRTTIEQLIALARLDRGETKVAAFDITVLARQVAESMRPLAQELHVDPSPAGTEVMVVGDERDLREAIVNIVENAVKYAPGSPIDMRVSSTDDTVVLEIADAGPGIAEEDREHVFERFHRGSSHPEVEGSGLGLAIAKRAVERANGRITLTSELGRGTAVTLYLPAAIGARSTQSTA